MKLITNNEKWKLYMVNPDEVFDILGKGNGEGLYCRVLKGKFQKTTHELRNLKVCDIKNYISAAKNNDPNEFIIFYRVAENRDEHPMLVFTVNNTRIKISKRDCMEAAIKCDKGCDMVSYCPFFGRKDIETHLMCRDILKAFAIGDYRVEEADKK